MLLTIGKLESDQLIYRVKDVMRNIFVNAYYYQLAVELLNTVLIITIFWYRDWFICRALKI